VIWSEPNRRTLQDLPCAGKILRLVVQVRRFFCRNADLTTSYARRATRFTQALSALGLADGEGKREPVLEPNSACQRAA